MQLRFSLVLSHERLPRCRGCGSPISNVNCRLAQCPHVPRLNNTEAWRMRANLVGDI